MFRIQAAEQCLTCRLYQAVDNKDKIQKLNLSLNQKLNLNLITNIKLLQVNLWMEKSRRKLAINKKSKILNLIYLKEWRQIPCKSWVRIQTFILLEFLIILNLSNLPRPIILQAMAKTPRLIPQWNSNKNLSLHF